MKLYIVRHAFAGQHGDPRYPDDSLRPLTGDGRKKFARLVKQIAEHGFHPRVIATSPLLRCRQTAEIIAELVPGCAEPVELPELAPGSELSALLAWTVGQETDRACWVGHSPDVERLTGSLVGNEHTNVRFGKGTIAAIDFDDRPPASSSGELCWLVTTKILGG